jgi:3-oxoacyl-[acyl-carrier protein] reductase
MVTRVSDARTAFVTGGSRGIGRATVLALARRGDRVGFCYANDERGADKTAQLAEAEGLRAVGVRADVAEAKDVDHAFDEVERELGPVTILVNNAGITRDGLVARMSDEHWQAVIDTNLTGAFHTIRRATKSMMKARYGRVVNVASVGGHMGNAGQANYAAAKAGLIAMTKTIGVEIARKGVTVNAVAPGFIETQMTAAVPLFIRQAGRRMTSLGQGGLPVDVAETHAWFASPASGRVNGQVVRVCGQSLLGA